jgi:isoamylase
VPSPDDDADLYLDDDDSADAIPKCIVVDPSFDWEDDAPPNHPWQEMVIYEVHVKGYTKLHQAVREDLRGTYAGLASEPALEYLQSLGVTAVELLPIHHIADEGFLHDRGLTNYWGYSSIGYLAPHALYSATGRHGEQVREFKGMVKALHKAGIEVILDVVYNHTAEGNHLGPMLSFRGVDNQSYYRLMPDDLRFYMDFTGTGNSLNPVHPSVLRLIMDSLRYFVIECHVDGFRFDLASALAREFYEVDRLSAFFDTIHQDPVLSQVKLIAEPWDVGPGGYQVGNFPVLWAEWNGLYRDVMRDFWRGQSHVSQFASRFTGSSDLYKDDGRTPFASINFITAHDGFTLRDLVSYNHKHNEANGGNDGTDDNRSWNHGAEGPTDDPEINKLRARQQRNFLVTLLLSQGAPMILGGDEFGRTQHGNNNAWCQDNDMSWFQWDAADSDLFEFTKRVIALRQAHPVFRREAFLTGREVKGSGLPDVWWFRPDGRRMTQKDWQRPDSHTIGVFLNGQEIPNRSHDGADIVDDSFLLLFNAYGLPVTFTLPTRRFGARWTVELATGDTAPEGTLAARAEVHLDSRSLVLLRRA